MSRAQTVDPNPTRAVLPQGSPLHGEVPRQLDQGRLGRVVHGAEEALVGDGAGHARDEADAAVALVLEHLACRGRGGHENGRVVDLHHAAGVLDRVLEGGRDLLDGRGGDGAVEAPVLARNLVNDGLEIGCVGHIDLAVGE